MYPALLGADTAIDIPGAVYTDLVNYWYSMPYMTGGRSKSELRTVAEMVLPVYIFGRLYDDIPAPSVLPDGGWLASANRELVDYMETRSGLVGEVVRDFLMVTHDAVQQGIIPASMLQPATWEQVAPPSLIDKLTPGVASVADFYGDQFTKFIIAGAVVAAAVGITWVVVKR